MIRLETECVVFVSLLFLSFFHRKNQSFSHPIEGKSNCNKNTTNRKCMGKSGMLHVEIVLKDRVSEWVSEYGLMEMLGCAYVCVVQWACRVTSGGSSLMCLTFFQSSLECVGTRKKTDCRTAWASKNSLYKRIKCKAFAKCFKDFRIVQLWCFNIVRLVFHSFSQNYNYSSYTSYLNIINDF